MFCFFPADYMSSTYTDKKNLLTMHKQAFLIGNLFNRAAIGFSQIAFPIIVVPKDDHIDSVQEEKLCLRYWIMI